ncbi:MAG: DUF5361 domain-containing protein [Clostridiales Family XIII bacterium]|jgi:hypothetical protein|nr:DUF5361 domain-containing protein [Clostridiales Family XIII bacterium]
MQVRADFQEHYGLNLDDMGEAYSRHHAAELLVMLPQKSRVWVAMNPGNAWGWQEHFMSSMEFSLRWLVWAKTKDGQKNRNRPKPIRLRPEKAKKSTKTMTADQMKAYLSRQRI